LAMPWLPGVGPGHTGHASALLKALAERGLG
jgi:hypothetical protein